MKKAGLAVLIIFIFLTPLASGPAPEERFPSSARTTSKGDDFLLSDWQDANSGNGNPLLGNLNGLRVASGTSVIDYTHSGYVGIDPPLGWSSGELEGQLDHLSLWVDDVLVNPKLDANHEELWFPIDGYPEYNGDPFFVPDGWTLIKNDIPSAGTQHPQHGCLEINSYSGNGYDNTMGWRFDANYGSGETIDPSVDVYMSQLISAPWRTIYSAEISFSYYVSSTSVMDDDFYIFTRLEGYTSKHHVFESTDTIETWLETTASVPSSFLQYLENPNSMLFDIGLGTDLSGLTGASDHEVYIDEIELRFLVRPFPEEIDLRANGAKVTGGTPGSVTPYVPDGTNRDCYSSPDSNGGSGGIDLNGYSNNGWLDVGADVPLYPDWSTAFTYQVGLQFPLHVPQGAAITSANLQVEAVSDSTGYPGMRIYVANEDNVAAFTSEPTLLPDKYDWVNTSIYWRPTTWSANGRYDTPDIAALIQDVVSRPGWQSGNYICLMIDYSYSNQQYAYNQIKGSSGFTQADLARLFVDFIEVAPADTIPSFRFNKNIVIDHTKVASDLQGFPVLVDIWDADLHIEVQSDGDDIAFLYNDQVIPHELEVFDKQGNGTHAHLSAWVKVPYLSSVRDTTLIMVYGDENLGSQENPEDIWNMNYPAVWHLNENPANPQWSSTFADYLPHQPQIQDVASPSSDGTSYGSMTSNDLVSGIVGSAIDLEGGNDYLDFGTPSELQMNGAFTVEAWFYADYVDNDYLVVKSGESNYRGWDISFDDDPSISPAGWVMFRWSPDGVSINTIGYERVDTGLWYQVVGVFSPSEYARFYLNGELVGEMTSGVSASVNNPNRPLRIGRRSDSGGTSYFDGIVDEVRISSVARSDAWIRTQYINQRSPGQFMTVGDESVNFRFRKDITVDHNQVASDLTGFPVLIDIYDTDLRTDVQPDGDDIIFTSNGRSFPHEIELFDQQFNSSHAHLVAWVKAELSSASDTVISMVYGNPSMGSQENPNEVWDSRYNGVWHLGDASGDARDSTYYRTDGTLIGNPTREVGGQVGYAYDFDAIDDVVNFGNPADEHLDFGANDFTVSMWINVDASTGNWQLPLYKGGASASDEGYEFETSTDGQYFYFYAGDGTTNQLTDGGCTVVFDSWIYLVGVVDRTSDTITIFKDGYEFGTPNSMSGIGSVSSDHDLVISRDQDGRRTNAMVDEVRISSIARSAGWVLTEFRNQNDPSSFYSLGVEHEVIPLNQAPISYQYEKEITIDHNKVDSDLAGFPVLINIYDTDLRTDVQSDGDDIVFVRDGWLLNHEIELFEQDYNTSHAHLVAWVRTDLSSSSNTVFSMHYGNPTAGNQENPTGVWDTSFAAVWHLRETPLDDPWFFDSTLNSNDGTAFGSMDQNDQVPAQIDGGIDFDGDDDFLHMVDSESLDITGAITIEAWAYYEGKASNLQNFAKILCKSLSTVEDPWHVYALGLDNSAAGSQVIQFELSDGTFGTHEKVESTTVMPTNTWMHIAGVFDGSEMHIYVNGFDENQQSYTNVIGELNQPLHIGNWITSTDNRWNGIIDEIRLSRVARSADWILTEFKNQNDPDSFYSISDEIVPSAFGEYDYRKSITIATGSEPVSTGYSTSLTFDHGALVSAGKSQADGDDIRIAYWNGSNWNELDRVLDSDSLWNIGNTKIWFQIQSDIPASSSDDHYYIYYGDSAANFPPNDHAKVFQFYDGFENGDLSAWDAWNTGSAGDDISAVTNPPPNTGTYSARCEIDDVASPQAIVWENFADETSLLARTHIYLDPSFSISGGGHVTVMQYVDTSSGWRNQLSVTIRDDLTLYVWNDIAGEAYGYGTTSTLSTGSWYMLEIQATISDTDGEVRLWLDGNLEIDVSGKNIGTEGIDRYCAGLYWASPQTEPNIVYADDAFLRQYVNPEPTTALGPELAQSVSFNYKKDIVVDNTKVAADLTDFPLLIDIYDADLKTKAQSDGDDIVFTIDAVTRPHELEFFDQAFNSTHAHLTAWVKVDLSSTVDTTITMYYGNPTIGSQESPSDVWNSDYLGVWHLGEASGGSNAILDSTSQANHGTDVSSPGFGVSGAIGNAISFTGEPYIQISDSASLDSITDEITMEFWTRADPLIWETSVFAKGGEETGAFSLFYYRSSGSNDICFNLDGVTVGVVQTGVTVTRNDWMHVVLTYDGSFVRVYRDGSLLYSNPFTGNIVANNQPFYIGTESDYNDYFEGIIDEARISNNAKSLEWVLSEYRNQNDPASFYSIGIEETTSGTQEPSLRDATGYQFSTNSTSSVTVGSTISLSLSQGAYSLADDLSQGTSFSLLNGSIPVWTANVLISPPPEIDAISFEVSYTEGEWFPVSVMNPSGEEMSFATNWTCFDGRLIVGANVVNEYGVWKIQFQDRNHVFDALMGPSGGPYSSSSEFTIGEDIEFQFWSSGTFGSTISLDLTDPSGSTWYSGPTKFQGKRFSLPYYHRKDLTISQDIVAKDLVNFPVLIDLYDTDLRTDVRADGRDIAFAIGEETLAHELELFEPSFNLTHAHLVAWVNVPLLSGSTETAISMYYGNPMAPIVYDSGPVWDSGYLGVWHLSESGTGATDEYQDSSQHKQHGTGGEGNTSFVPTQVTGKIGSGQDFNDLDGHYDLIDCGDSPQWNIDGYQITLEAWVQHDITPNNHVYGIMNHKGWYDGYALYINFGGGSTLKPTFTLPGDTHMLVGANDVTGLDWHHIVATYDGSLMRIYVDGVQDPTVLAKTDAILPSSYEQGFWIGHGDQPKDKVWSAEWDGQIDEVRISDVVRSASWIQTEFQNQNDPSSFFSIGVEESVGYSESETITLDSSASAGVWYVSARYSDDISHVNNRVGMFSRNFIVKRGTSLSLIAPGDAVADGISTKLIGEQLYVEFELEDTLNAALVSGATISMNWSVSGVPTDVQLNDYGDGRYGKTLNTSDLGSYGRWRLDLETSHPFYTNATDYFYLDLSHRTVLTYEPPFDTSYGDNFEVRLTLRDKFDDAPLAGATISCNATIVGLPIDYGNGTYLVTVDSTGFSTGEHTFRFTATPATSFLLSSSIDVQFNYQPIATDATLLSPDTVEAPWGHQANTSIYWYDIDNAGSGVEGGTFSVSPFVQIQTFEDGGGYYTITIDVSSLTPGTHFFNLTCSKLNYQSSTVTVSVTILAHRTTSSVYYNSTIPVGTDTYFDVSWIDLDHGSILVDNGNLSQVTLDWGTGSDSFSAFSFLLDTSSWAVGSYTINVSISATDTPRFYIDSYFVVQLEIRKLNVYLSWDPLEPFPNGNDFVMFIYVNVSEPDNPIDGTPITGLDQTYFSARNETGGLYIFKSFTNLGNGLYQLSIDSARFLEGQYKIIVFVDFIPAENYTDSITPEVSFSYRPILTYLSSPDYPTVTTSFDTNVTVTLSYVDIDHVQNIMSGTITSEGASIVWQHIADGIYEVLIIVQGWDLGAHEVNLTADASGYQAKTLTFQILVQIAYAYARSSVSIIDLPVGDTAVFYADYWDITHDEPILGATINHNWTYPLSISWTGDQYRIELPSIDTDGLGSYLVIFNFSKGPNYQFGYFNISIILRTHLTEFRLASAVEPTSYNAMVNISVYCGDLDNDAGIVDVPVSLSIYGDSGLILSTFENDTVLGNGYYIIRFAATNLGTSGIFELTVYFNWTGLVQKYYNRSVAAFVRIVGETSDLDLIDSAEPTPYLGNLSYTYLYSELYSGNGISNVSAPAGNVFIYVEFVGQSFSQSLCTITEDVGNPGYYTIEFNSTIFAGPGVYTMSVYVNWSKGQEPFYGNWTDTLSVRIIPRSTLINLIPPESSPYGVNATFSFSFDDVAEGSTYRIANSSQMTIIIGLPDYSITYNESTRQFHISFNTSILGAPLGNRQFTIGVSWTGAPYYANVTGRTVIISVRFRETEFDYSTISPTPYGDNVTLRFTFTDVTLGISEAIDNGLVTLYNSSQEIPVSEYSFTPLGNGEYEIELKTTYFTNPGIYTISVQMSTSHFYYAVITASRTLSLQYRLTILLVEPVAETPYNNPLELVFHYSDVLTLGEIGNSSTPTTIRILNGSSWRFSSVWRGASEDYLLTIQTYNQNLEINREYVLWIEINYPDSSPFYLSSEAFVSFTVRERATNLELISSPEPTQYLESTNFTAYYQDSLSLDGIAGAIITLTVGLVDLVEGVDYILQSPVEGIYYISLNTTALGPAGTTVNLVLRASWTSSAPYYSTSTLSLTLSVTQRNSITEILASTTQVKFLENVTFTISYSDETTGQAIQLSKDQFLIYSEGTLLQGNDFSMNYLSSRYEVSINSSVLIVGLISNWNITFYLDWQNNVAPYYADGRASAWISVVNRVGSVIRDTAPTVPIHDNMTLKFTYVDDSTGAGINDAIVLFDCLSPSGLVEGVDFWILRNAGNYSLLVDSTSLGNTGTFTFSLRLLWNPTLVPFYRNTTTIFLQGTVRLIQAQLTNEEPNPSTVPINDNVSVVLNLQDLDHTSPISGAESSFSVRYKTNASGPAIWSITPISPGVYELIVDCSDAGATGTNTLIITLSFSDYQTVEVQVPFQIRLRQGELNEVSSPSTFYGETTYVIVELVDKDAGNIPISDAILIITWPDIGYTPDYSSLGNGSYIINLTTASLDAGLYTLVVGAQKSNYFISDISVPVQIKSIPTELILPQTTPDVYWGEDVSIWAMFNDTRDNILISGAALVYQFGVLSGSLTEEILDPGNYSFTVDTGNLAVATTYVVSITATLKNYVTITRQVIVNVLKLPIALTVASEAQQEVFKGSPVNITVYVNNTYSNVPLLGAAVEVTWMALGPQTMILSPVPGRNGYYAGFIDTSDLFVGDYVITIRTGGANYLSVATSASISIKQIATVLLLDALTSTYSTRTFNWSDTIRIGVYVLAPLLNESYPLSTGIPDCTVQWSLSGTAFTGEFLNGTSIAGPGYFYIDFETWDYSASTYTLRITAYPNIGMFAYSSNLTTLIIEPIETSVASTYLSPKIWGWTGWVNLTYWDLLFDRGIAGANIAVDWDGVESTFRHVGNGTYQIFINASLVSPGIYPVSVRFLMDNYKSGTGVFTLNVREVPTSINVFTPAINQIDDDLLNLEVPYGDVLPLVLFYNDTWYNRGIPGATEMTGVVIGPGIPDRDDILIEEMSYGNYSLLFDTTRWTVSHIPYRVILGFYLGNWSRATINIQITIIDVPTGLQVEGSTSLSMSYGQEFSIWVFYYDAWEGHAGEGIAGGSINATSLDTQYVVVSLNQSDLSRPGWYEIRLRSRRTQGSTIVSIILSKENHEAASESIAISVEPSEFDLLIERAIIFGVPIGLVLLAGAVLWTRLFNVPKRLREIRGMVRTISKGKIPKPPDNILSRQEIVADLFNDIAEPVGITKMASSMPTEAITTDVPEIDELLVQLSILSKLTPDELEDFKLDVSKMKLSEQVSFVKEVINQEAIKQGRIERKSMEMILEETALKARAVLAGEEIEQIVEPKLVEERVEPEQAEEPIETTPEPIDFEEIDSTDVLSENELKEIRQRLLDAGIKGSELETIMDQTRELPRELAEELLKSILGTGGEDE